MTALERLGLAAVQVVAVMEAGERDPSRQEQQELDDAIISYGREILGLTKRDAVKGKR